MAIVRSNEKASLRITTSSNKSVMTVGGIKPNVDPTGAKLFTDAIGTLRGKFNGFIYLNVTADIEDVI